MSVITHKNKLPVIFFGLLVFGGMFLSLFLEFNRTKNLETQKNIPNLISPHPTRELVFPSPSPIIPSPTIVKKQVVILDVPFTVQAPFAEWKDPRQQDACEEASVLMAMHWVKNEPIASKEAAKEEILAISAYEENLYKNERDTSAADTGKRIIEGYYNYHNYEVKPIDSADDILNELDSGNLVIVPANGQLLGNPNFTPPGPERHMVVVKGYDRTTSQFITNDTGISQGEGWRYTKDVLFNAIRDYETGDHAPIIGIKKVMIVVRK